MTTNPKPNMTAEFIAPDDARWKSMLARVDHDFYHLPEYVKLEAHQAEHQPTAFYAECGDSRFLIPLMLSSLPAHLNAPDDWRDAATPYGYPCPLLEPAGDEECLRNFLQAFRETAGAQNIVAAFLRLHPLMPLPREPLEECDQLIRHGQTVYFDLSATEEDARKAFCSNHRRDIKKLIASGYEVRLNEWSHFEEFIAIYRATMKRLDAGAMYFFEGDYFPRLRELLGERVSLCTVVSSDGDVAAGGLFVNTCGMMQYHLAGSSDEHYQRSPIKLMVHWMRRWAAENNAKYLHMGGGLGGREDSLFRFKAGFSNERADFFTYRIIPDPAKYQDLVSQWENVGGEAESNGGFFPLYRRPLPQSQSPE